MNKKLLIIMVFLSTPIFGMEYLNQIKRWITQNSSDTVEITPLPTLPIDIQTKEIIEQLLNLSNTRHEALTLLSNYACVNKAIADYVKNNKLKLQKILNQKFGLSLTTLASGNYDDPDIKDASFEILLNAAEKFSTHRRVIDSLVTYIKTKKDDPCVLPIDYLYFVTEILESNYPNKFKLAAVILGRYKHEIFIDDFYAADFLRLVKNYIGVVPKDKNWNQIVTLIINTALKLYGHQFINYGYDNEPSLFNFVQNSKNEVLIKYLEGLNPIKITPVLPYDVQTSEIIKQLLNISNNRDQALTLLSNYARANKKIADFVKNNKVEIQRLLNEKFGVSLTALASGDYDNPQIKDESIKILLAYADKFRDSEWKQYILNLTQYIKTGERNLAITPINEINALIKLIKSFDIRSFDLAKFDVAAVLLGVLNYTFNTNKAVFGKADENAFVDSLKFFTVHMGSNKNYTQIIKLIINTAVKIFGPQVIDKEFGIYFYFTKTTLLNYVKQFNNLEAIKYLETINKLNK